MAGETRTRRDGCVCPDCKFTDPRQEHRPMAQMSKMFDGWTTFLVANEDFVSPCTLMVTGFEELDEEEELDPYETPAVEVQYAERPGDIKKPLEFQIEGMAWAGLAMALRSLSMIVGGDAKAWQHNVYEGGKMVQPVYTFQFVPGDAGHQEGKL